MKYPYEFNTIINVPSTCTKSGVKTDLFVEVIARIVGFSNRYPIYDIIVCNINIRNMDDINWDEFSNLVQELVDGNICGEFYSTKEIS